MERVMRVLFPARAKCMGCGSVAGQETDWLCADCRKNLAQNWHGPLQQRGFEGAAFAHHYRGAASGLVRNLKYHGIKALAEEMTAQMLTAYRGICPTGVELVVPVPMYRKRKRERGFNHSQLLAERIAQKLDLPMAPALTRTRNTRQQALLEHEARMQNQEGSIKASDVVSGKRVLLIDDVYTSGATALTCAKALRDSGASAVYLLVYAIGGANK